MRCQSGNRGEGAHFSYTGATPVAVSVLFPGEAEALIGSTALKVQVSDELLLAVDKLFGMKVVELG